MRASVATHARADASSYASRAMSRSKSSPPRTSGMTIANSRGPSKMSSSGATCGCIGSAERIASSARIARSRTAAQSALSMSLTATSARGGARARAACTRVEPPRPMHGPSSYSSANESGSAASRRVVVTGVKCAIGGSALSGSTAVVARGASSGSAAAPAAAHGSSAGLGALYEPPRDGDEGRPASAAAALGARLGRLVAPPDAYIARSARSWNLSHGRLSRRPHARNVAATTQRSTIHIPFDCAMPRWMPSPMSTTLSMPRVT